MVGRGPQMKITIIFIALILAACASPKVVPREGKPVKENLPQAAEQCKVQPWLDWCRK